MPCKHVALPGGGYAIVKFANPRRSYCKFCEPTRPSWVVALWDGLDPSHKSGTCDKGMCEFHRHRRPNGIDLCPDCVKRGIPPAPAEQATLFK